METLNINDIWLWVIPGLYLVCFAGLAYVFVRIIQAGAESYSDVHAVQTAQQFADIFLFIPPRRILELAWTAALACFILLFMVFGDFHSPAGGLRGALAGGVTALCVLALPRRILLFLRRRRLLLFNEQLVDALMTMSNALRAGASILQAFEHIVRQNLNPISQEFDLFLQQTRVGVKFEEALGNLEKRVSSEDLTLMIRSIEIARQTGGNLTEVFDKIGATIRERIRIQRRVRMLTSQGRMQGIVVGLMPLVLAFAMFLFSPDMMLSFCTSSIGIMALVVVLILEGLGALLIRKIIDIDI